MNLGLLGTALAMGIAAIGSAIGIGIAGQASIGAWKKCYMSNKAAPFILTVFAGRGAQMLAVAPDTVRSQLHHGIRVAKGTEGSDCSPFLACVLWKEQILRTVCVKCLKKSFELEVISGTRTVFIFQSTFRLFFS